MLISYLSSFAQESTLWFTNKAHPCHLAFESSCDTTLFFELIWVYHISQIVDKTAAQGCLATVRAILDTVRRRPEDEGLRKLRLSHPTLQVAYASTPLSVYVACITELVFNTWYLSR